MSKQRYPEEFKAEAVKQITERGHKVADVSARLGVSQHGLYQWIKAQRMPAGDRQVQVSQTDEPCPQAGWWSTPAEVGSRRYFEAGEVMPVIEGCDYGATFWQWDSNQSGEH